eukprot:11657901-Ditylum_brightwellii.AAC.1
MAKLKRVRGDTPLGRFVRGKDFNSVWKFVKELQAVNAESSPSLSKKDDKDDDNGDNHDGGRDEKIDEENDITNDTS